MHGYVGLLYVQKSVKHRGPLTAPLGNARALCTALGADSVGVQLPPPPLMEGKAKGKEREAERQG